MSDQRNHYTILGGGIVGLSSAYHLLKRKPGIRLSVLEKEPELALHQTGRNSGVIHSGIYYKPGSFKARLCREGRQSLIDYCQAKAIPHDICGKIILATDASELPALSRIADRARANGVEAIELDPRGIQDVEPEARGVKALKVPASGIVDYRAVCLSLAEDIRNMGGEIRLNQKVIGLSQSGQQVTVETESGDYAAGHVINCTGLYCDRVLQASQKSRRLPGQGKQQFKIVPFRGEYYELKPSATSLVKHLIYPVPDSRFPFLGVHFTRMIGGGVEAGPNAVLAFAREGYRKTDINLKDLTESIRFPGFQKLALKHMRQGADEMMRSLSKTLFAKALKRLVPAITEDDLTHPTSGIRAQALKRDGSLLDDFHFEQQGNLLHVLNAPSPAATSSLAIGDYIASQILR